MLDVADWTQWGLWGLFVSAFLAGTVLAFGSEAVLVALLIVGVSPVPTVAVATSGNVLGALSVVALGRLVARGKPLERPWLRRWAERARPEDPERLERARQRLERWGPRSLLLSWVPVIGDALVFAAGILRLGLGWVLLYLVLGKFLRYAGLAWAVLAFGWGDSL
ncbi:MAG: YqaA family protein [Acidobacteriota bacterium]